MIRSIVNSRTWLPFTRNRAISVRYFSGQTPSNNDNGDKPEDAKKGDEWWGSEDASTPLFEDDEDDDGSPPKSVAKFGHEEEFVRRSGAAFTEAPKIREPVVEGTPKLSMAQALFLAKEAGIFTTREVQTHLIKSPSFTKAGSDSPFLLENFFKSEGDDQAPSLLAPSTTISPIPTTTGAASPSSSSPTATSGSSTPPSSTTLAPRSVHEFFSKLSLRSVPTFGSRGREWKVRAEGKGTRKRSTAHVVIERGTGVVKINGEEDLYKRWPLLANRFDVLFPFEACGAAGLFDVYIRVSGGGISGQAGAARLAVGRALVSACGECENDLKDTLVLHEDTRQKTSKFPGKKGAHARHNWTLR